MRRLIGGDNQIAKMSAVGKIRGFCKAPIKEKLAGIVRKKETDKTPIDQGARMSGMNRFLPGVDNNVEMEHQRVKLGEVTKKKKEEDEE